MIAEISESLLKKEGFYKKFIFFSFYSTFCYILMIR